MSAIPIRQFDIWVANLSKRMGTEPGKQRPVIVVQSNLLNEARYPSTWVCPLTTCLSQNASILRVYVNKASNGLDANSEIVVDQLRAIDNIRLVRQIGQIPLSVQKSLQKNLEIILR